MAAFSFTYPQLQQHPHFHLDSLFMSTNNFIINPVYFPSMPDSSSFLPQIGETNIEPSIMSDKTKQTTAADTPTTSSIVVDLEGDDQVINSQEITNPPMVTKKRKNGSSLDSDINQSKSSKPKSKKQKKSDSELKEEKRIRDELKKKQKQERDELRAAVVPDYKTQADYVHVRARRGQANDSHSLAERVRREKISERLKMLQSLVPGCDKVNSKANMLDEIINYVQSLQVQVEMLSMKLAYMNPILYDFGVDLEDFYLQKPISSTLAAATSSPSPPLPLTTTHQDSMTPAAPAVTSTTAPTEFANVTPTFSSTSNDTCAIPVHDESDSFSALQQQEVQQQKLNDFSQVLLQPEIPNSEEDLLCYMDYYQHHQRQEGATNLFYYE